jgi:hypothetical protein
MDVQQWLSSHGLAETSASTVVAARLAARRRTRLVDSVVLAVMIIAATALAVAPGRLTLAGMVAVMVAVLVVRWRLDMSVQRADQRAASSLTVRATHAVHPSLLAVLGRPHAWFAASTFAFSLFLAISALIVPSAKLRYPALILLIGLVGLAAGIVLRLRHLLARPVVAADEASLIVDVLLRVEDAREVVAPTVLWSLPVVLLFGFAPAWWRALAIGFVLVGVVLLVIMTKRTPSSVRAARQAMGVVR